MRRWLRILLNVGTLVSLLLCVAILTLWVRSYWSIETLKWELPRGDGSRSAERRMVSSVQGKMIAASILERTSERFAPLNPSPGKPVRLTRRVADAAAIAEEQFHISPRELDGFRLMQFGWLHRDYPRADGGLEAYRALVLPYWMILTIFGALPLTRVAKLLGRVRRRRGSGHCPTCNYDLRATPDRCPECGAVPPAPKA
jgi:hypothetical protein